MHIAFFIVAIVAGLAQAASIAAPWDGQPQWWLQLISLAVLAALVQRASSWQRAAFIGWVFAFAWFAEAAAWSGASSVICMISIPVRSTIASGIDTRCQSGPKSIAWP